MAQLAPATTRRRRFCNARAASSVLRLGILSKNPYSPRIRSGVDRYRSFVDRFSRSELKRRHRVAFNETAGPTSIDRNYAIPGRIPGPERRVSKPSTRRPACSPGERLVGAFPTRFSGEIISSERHDRLPPRRRY